MKVTSKDKAHYREGDERKDDTVQSLWSTCLHAMMLAFMIQ